jgi:hypothetical protein
MLVCKIFQNFPPLSKSIFYIHMAQNINRTFHKSGAHKAIPTTSKNISADGLGGTNKFSTIFVLKMFPTESKIFHDKQKSAN